MKSLVLALEKQLARVLGKSFLVKGKCRRCGRCCRQMALTLGGRKIGTEEDFDTLKKLFPAYQRFVIQGTAPGGALVFSCTRLGSENLCGDYRRRPSFCRQFPDVQSFDLLHLLPEGCGYSLIPLREFNEFLRDEMK
ncbi:MAG: YkgJ family cysteine cluster protein [Candidatus Eremiobacteraeota bacterium]|nr:YkgJ family cysteine cluster protein [Candidatus Eremiobacteraeota bacterium]